jgi:hypothetical protein
MLPHRRPFAAVAAVACVTTLGIQVVPSPAESSAPQPPPSGETSSPPDLAPEFTGRIGGHDVHLDTAGKLLSWSLEDAPYAHVARIAWHALETKFGLQDNGVVTWLSNSRFNPVTFEGINWPHNPAGLYAMLTDSAVLWYAFSGDRAAVDVASRALDYQLAHGTTPASWDWARVPYASANAGDVEYRGADDTWCNHCGRGDGTGVIEPDKVAELGFAYLQMFELRGKKRHRDAAIACADALAEHVRDGDERRSPWPFRVFAKTGVAREEYSSNVVGALVLFDELRRLSLGRVDAYAEARARALDWLMRVPLNNDAWSGYFEDIDIQQDPTHNPNQYTALRTARWLMAHPDADPQWRAHVSHLLAWAASVFGGNTAHERGVRWGAVVMSEQGADMAKMGSHTARFGATSALWSATTGDMAAREQAARALNWATYMCRDDGIVAVGEDENEGWWFSDGYGDYIRHFLMAMGSVPEWAPSRENHLLQTTSVVTRIAYAKARIAWTTFDADAIETLRLTSRPASVSVGGAPLDERPDLEDEGFVTRPLTAGGVVVRVRHRAPGEVVVNTRDPDSANVSALTGTSRRDKTQP